MMSTHAKVLIGLSIATLLAPLTQTIYSPILPEIGHEFGANVFMVNLTISIFTIILAVGQFFMGSLSDTRGRRGVLLPGLLLFIAGSIICFVATDYYLFLLGRIVQAVGISTASVVAAAVIGDIYSPQERGRALSVYQTMVFLGPVFGPVLGSFISGVLNWKWIFLLLVVLGLASFIYNKIILYETLAKETAPRKINFKTFKKIIFHPSSFAIMLFGFIQFYSFYIFIVFIPSLLDKLFALSLEIKGLFFLPLTLGIVFGVFLSGRLDPYLTRRSILILCSYSCSFIALLFSVFLQFSVMTSAILILLLLAYGIMHGLSLPSQSATIMNLFQEEKGTSIGAFNFTRFLGGAMGPLGGAIIYNLGGDFALYLTMSFFLLLSAFTIQKYMYDPFQVSNGT